MPEAYGTEALRLTYIIVYAKRLLGLGMNSSDQGIFPAAEPPPGVIPNFDHPQSRAIVEYVGVGICLGVTLIFVLLRVYVKLVVTHAWGWDDGELPYCTRHCP